ncbi:MAG: DUF1289 domain-containing protein [Polymorphobacter sp.]
MPVRSPCTNVCAIDRHSGWCDGCARRIDEIMRWPQASEAERTTILAALPDRRTQMASRQRWWRR